MRVKLRVVTRPISSLFILYTTSDDDDDDAKSYYSQLLLTSIHYKLTLLKRTNITIHS